MAEIILSIVSEGQRGGKAYGDGDIVTAVNDRHILCMYTHRICHVKNMTRESSGNLSINSLAWHLQNTTYKYKFTRVSRDEIEREDLSTNETKRFNNTPNANGERIDVPLFIARRKAHPRNRIFGSPGAEIWFGGKQDYSQAKLDLVWDEIETQTVLLRANHKDLRVPVYELKKRLYLKCIDFLDVEASTMLESENDETDPENPVLTYKRSYYVDFAAVPELNSRTTDIYDKRKSVDVRTEKLFDTNTIKIKK